ARRGRRRGLAGRRSPSVAAALTPLRLGTRGSALALAQARAVAALLGEASELVEIATAGDADRAGGDKSRWTGTLEAALVAGALEEERAAVGALGASCRTPVGVFAGGSTVRGFAGLPDGSAWLVDEAHSGAELAERMLAAGAAELLREAAS